jgi:hypothetical protein
MKNFKFQTLLKIFFSLAVIMSLMTTFGCSIFVNKESQKVSDNPAATKESTDVEISTGLTAPAGNRDAD